VSVVIAVYNGERYLREAIRSVQSQGHPDLEVVVIDDGSTDASAAVIAEFPGVRTARQANAGQATALNHGVRLARGALLAFNDSDDLWTPGRLAVQLHALLAAPEIDAVYGHVEQFLDEGVPASVAAGLTPERRVQPSRLHTAMLIRREAFDRVGPFREDLRIGSVVEWASRAKDLLTERVLDEIVLRRRLHGANIGLTQKRLATEGYLAIARAALERRREKAT
jgi:glycosyltransferase involved in cell wall biosynthesis